MATVKSKDPTATKRTAKHKAELLKSGGKRLTINLQGHHVKTLNTLVEEQVAGDHASVIRKLIEEKTDDRDD